VNEAIDVQMQNVIPVTANEERSMFEDLE
jgi:hypothetical protein